MRATTFYRLSLILPVLVPIAAWALAQAGFFRELAFFLAGTLLIGGIPYLAVAAVLIAVSFRVSEARFEYWWHFSPFLMALAFAIFGIAMNLYQGDESGYVESRAYRLFMVGVVGGLYCLLVGYAYVLTAKLLYFVLQKAKMIKTDVPRHVPFA